MASDNWFGDDDDDNDATSIQSTHGRSTFTLPYPLPGFFPTTLLEPYLKLKRPTRHSLLLNGRFQDRSRSFC